MDEGEELEEQIKAVLKTSVSEEDALRFSSC